MLKTRVISAMGIIAVTITALYFGGLVLLGILTIISMIGFYEMNRALKVHKEGEKRNALEYVGYGMILVYNVSLYLAEGNDASLTCIVALILLLLFVYVFSFPKYHADQVMKTVFSFLYAPIMLSFIYLIRNLPMGQYLVWMIFICSWVCDTCAYAVGMMFGKHKLAPVLSPKKSIEGAIGGVAGSAIVGFLFGLLMQALVVDAEGMVLATTCMGAIGAVIAQIGDLSASAIKRNYDIKDYGTLIPGHGGIIDRFDSVIITAPIIYFLATMLLTH